MDKNLLNAFRRIEKKVADAKARERKEELAREQAELREREILRKQLIERLVLASTLVFSLFVLFLAWYTEGEIVYQTAGAIRSIASMDGGDGSMGEAKIDCTSKELHNSNYCVELRKMKIKTDWKGISLYSDGKDNPFALHDEKAK